MPETFEYEFEDDLLRIERWHSTWYREYEYYDDFKRAFDLYWTITKVWSWVLDSNCAFVWSGSGEFEIANTYDHWQLTTTLKVNPDWYCIRIETDWKELDRLAKVCKEFVMRYKKVLQKNKFCV